MKKKRVVSVQTRNNLILDSSLLVSDLITALSGIYFLFLPVGGYQGGRNQLYGVTIFFERHVWSDIHIWASVAIMLFAALHISLHWQWIINMTRSGIKTVFGKSRLNKYSQFNLGINILIGLSGLICGLSGLYFLLVPGAFHNSIIPDPMWLFTGTTWDLIHTWSGVAAIALITMHFYIHWKWAYKVIRKYGQSYGKNLKSNPVKQSVSIQQVYVKKS